MGMRVMANAIEGKQTHWWDKYIWLIKLRIKQIFTKTSRY